MSTTWVKVGYGILLGIVLALTAGFGAATFISEPRPPQPVGITFQQISTNSSDVENQREAKQFDSYFNDVLTYRGKYPDYQRNVFLGFAIAGLVLGIIGVALPSIVNYLRLGFMVGGGILLAAGTWFVIQPLPLGTENPSGILTLLVVGAPNVLDTAARFLRFAVSLVGVLLLLFVGLWRLTEWSAAPAAAPLAAAPAAGPPPAPASVAALGAAYAPAPPRPEDSLKWARPDERTVADLQPAAAPPTRVIEHLPPAPVSSAPEEGTTAG